MTGTARRGMSEQATDAAIDQACRMLRLPTIPARAVRSRPRRNGNN